MSDGTANFTGDCGECSKDGSYYKASSVGGMLVGQSATVNGNSPENCVVANDSAKVFKIELLSNAGFYKYQVRVDAQGPEGAFSGSMYLAFEDATHDVYYLSVYASRRESHTVSFNSSDPRIIAIYWSDHSFTVKTSDANRAKPDFQGALAPPDRLRMSARAREARRASIARSPREPTSSGWPPAQMY